MDSQFQEKFDLKTSKWHIFCTCRSNCERIILLENGDFEKKPAAGIMRRSRLDLKKQIGV